MSLPVKFTDPAIFLNVTTCARAIDITYRQLQCLAWTHEGKSATDIGQILGISGRTVEGHLAKVCRNLGVRTRIQAVLKAKELGFLQFRRRQGYAPEQVELRVVLRPPEAPFFEP